MKSIVLTTFLLPISALLFGCANAATEGQKSQLNAKYSVPQCNNSLVSCQCVVQEGQCTNGEVVNDLGFPIDTSCNAQFCGTVPVDADPNSLNNCSATTVYCGIGKWCTNGTCQPCADAQGNPGTIGWAQGTGGYWYNTCTVSSLPSNSTLCGPNSSWVQVDSGVKLTEISVGGDGNTVWATYSTPSVLSATYIRTNVNGPSVNGNNWSRISPNDDLTVVAAGKLDFVWGTKGNSNIYFRQGISTLDENGTGWHAVSGLCTWLSAALDYSLWCISSNGVPFYRVGSSQVNPEGESWASVSGKSLTRISVGNVSTIWGVDVNNQIYTRTGASSSNPGGTAWTAVPNSSNFQEVSVGSDGTVWAINTNRNVFQWVNGAWVENPNVILKRIAVGDKNNVWGIDATGSAVRCMNN